MRELPLEMPKRASSPPPNASSDIEAEDSPSPSKSQRRCCRRVDDAAKSGHIECLRWHEADAPGSVSDFVNSYGSTLLHLAAHYGHVACCRWMIEEFDLDILQQNKYGETAAHAAATQSEVAVLEVLEAIIGQDKMETVKNNRGRSARDNLHLRNDLSIAADFSLL